MKVLRDKVMLFVGVLLVALCAGLLARQWVALGKVRREIGVSRAVRHEQEAIEPLRNELSRLVSQDPERGLHAPVRAPLPYDGLRELPELLGAPARLLGLTVGKLGPDVETLSDRGYREIGVSVTVTGACSAFQRYLVELCRMPSLAELKSVTIRRAGPGVQEMCVAMSLRVAGRRQGAR